MAREAISKFYQRDQQEESREDCCFEALPSHGRNRSFGPEGSHSAGVLDSISELGRIGNSCGQVESVLRQRLAPAFYDGNRRPAPGSHNQGWSGRAQSQRLGLERQLCTSNAAPDASQSGRMEPGRQGSKVQAADGTRAQVKTG